MSWSADDAARALGASPRSVQRWCRVGRSPLWRPLPHELTAGGHARFREGEVRRWAAQNRLAFRPELADKSAWLPRAQVRAHVVEVIRELVEERAGPCAGVRARDVELALAELGTGKAA